MRSRGELKEKIEEFSFDVVIVGGGMSGCGAALAARSQGLKVALIQDRPLFGGMRVKRYEYILWVSMDTVPKS